MTSQAEQVAQEQMTVAEANAATDRIKAAAQQYESGAMELAAALSAAKEGRAYRALGYDTWPAYLRKAETSIGKAYADNLIRHAEKMRVLVQEAGLDETATTLAISERSTRPIPISAARTGQVLPLPPIPGGDWRFTRRALDLYLEQQEQITLAERGAAGRV